MLFSLVDVTRALVWLDNYGWRTLAQLPDWRRLLWTVLQAISHLFDLHQHILSLVIFRMVEVLWHWVLSTLGVHIARQVGRYINAALDLTANLIWSEPLALAKLEEPSLQNRTFQINESGDQRRLLYGT